MTLCLCLPQASRYPLLIDPQGQGLAWLKQLEADSNVVATTFESKNFRTSLEDALTAGTPLIVYGVGEELDLSLQVCI